MDDERLKQGGQVFGKDYFDELLERIREIRASERRFYQKITDLYASLQTMILTPPPRRTSLQPCRINFTGRSPDIQQQN